MILSETPVSAHTPLSSDQSLIDGVLAGQRRSLAKAITLIESTRPDHQQRAQQVLNALLPKTGNAIASVSPVSLGQVNPPSSRHSVSG